MTARSAVVAAAGYAPTPDGFTSHGQTKWGCFGPDASVMLLAIALSCVQGTLCPVFQLSAQVAESIREVSVEHLAQCHLEELGTYVSQPNLARPCESPNMWAALQPPCTPTQSIVPEGWPQTPALGVSIARIGICYPADFRKPLGDACAKEFLG
eukprot:6465482-Amphidinium_carterae.1